MRPRWLLAAVAVLVLSIAGAGCGSSGPSGPDRHAEYQQHLEPIARELHGVLSGFAKVSVGSIVYPAPPNAAKDAGAAVERFRSSLRSSATRLDRVMPPPGVAGDHNQLVQATRTLAGELNPVIVELKDGNLVGGLAALQELPGTAKVHRALRAIAAKGYSLPSGGQ